MDGQQQHQWQRSTFVLRLPNDEAAVVAEGLLVQHDPSLPATLFARITWYWHGVIVWTDYFLDHYEDDSDSSSEDSFYDEESSDEDYEDYYEVPGYDDDRDFEDYQYADGV